MKVSGIRDLAFSEPKAFLAWSMHQPFPAVPIPPPPPSQASAGHFPALSAQEGHRHSWNWLMYYSDGKGNLFKNIILSLTPSLWIIQENRQHPCQYIYIGEFSSSKGIHDSIGVWVPLHGFWIPATRFFVSGISNIIVSCSGLIYM